MLTNRVHCSELKAWNRAVVQNIGEIAVDAASGSFEAALSVRSWREVRLVQVASSAACVRGGRVARPGWFLLYNDAGACTVRQAGRQAELGDGELSLVRSDV